MEKREIPSILLEQYVLGELKNNRKAEIETEFGVDYLEAKQREIETQNDEFLTTHPVSEIKYQILKRQNSSAGSKPARRPAVLVPILSAAVLALVFAGIFPFLQARDSTMYETRIKGAGTHLLVYKENNGDPVLLSEGDAVRENDVIQIKYIPGGKKYGIIFSIDGRGSVTRMFPEAGTEAAALDPEKTGVIGYGYQLDDAPNFERFFFITSDKSFNVNRVIGAAEDLGGKSNEAPWAELRLPRGVEQSSFLLTKTGDNNE